MKSLRRILAVMLCVSILMSTYITVFAANESNTLGVTFEVTLNTYTLEQSSEEQQVVMTLTASEKISIGAFECNIVTDSPLEIATIAGGEELGTFTGAHYSIENKKIGWTSSDYENVSGVTTLAIITFTIPADTPAGDYNVGVENILMTADYGDNTWETSASASTTLTISGAAGNEPSTESYTAAVRSTDSTVAVDDTVTVNVGVSHSSDESFAAGEVKVSYDSALLAFDEAASTLGTAIVKDDGGVITLEDYGADKSFGTGVYVLVFKAIADGTASVELTSAAFIDKAGAVSSDLIEATISESTVSVVIEKKTYNVTLPDIFEGPALATDGEPYTFSAKDDENYDYADITATVGGESATVTDNGDGTYTIENVTGELVITGTRTEKSYGVTFTGNAASDITDGVTSATYNTDYTFSLPTAPGWAYSVDSITIGGEAYTGYSVNNYVYTIPGSAIKGDIVITVSKTDTEATVSVEGSGAGAASGYEPTANMNESYSLTILPEEGYSYTVTATMGGSAVELIQNGNSYTIETVTGDIVFTVERVVVVDGVSVHSYLTLNGTNMWLVLNNTVLASGKVATYNGNNMYWSDHYQAYCYLIIAETPDANEVKAFIGITDGAAEQVDYGMDVNDTGKVDASDAQLTYNMYNAVYSAFDSDATVEKFLRADVNGDKTVNVEDAAAIVGSLLQ